MAYRYEQNEKTGKPEIIIDGWENGIGTSPHNGFGNMKGVNIATEPGEVMCSFNRVKQSQTSGTTGVLTQVNTNTVSVSGITLLVGSWIVITNGGTTGLSGTYYYLSTGKLSLVFAQDTVDATGASVIVTGITSGTATFTTVTYAMANPVMASIEPYRDSSNATQTRYYILDSVGQVWVHDSKTLSNVDTPLWFLPNITINASTIAGRTASGLAVFNGWMTFMLDFRIYWRSTSALGSDSLSTFPPWQIITKTFHNTLVGHQGKMYYTDGNFIGSIFPNTSLLTGGANIQSYCSYTAVTTTGTVSSLIGGTYPSLGSDSTTRIPAVFFPTTGGTKPTAITLITVPSTVYYIKWLNTSTLTFEVYAAATGGSALDLQTGAVGTQYFNTFSPFAATGTLFVYSPQRLNLPFYETAKCLVEIGNMVMIGGTSNTLYPWNQVSALPGDVILLPENTVSNMITVNNMAYVFAGQNGNIYITNGSSASLVTSVPNYCAGIAGTPASYIYPYFTWGGAMYVEGRVYFSILDQTSAKTGNCGGIWSFVPPQNFSVEQQTGLSLRMENQSSYATFDGVCTLLIPSLDQGSVGPQYWSAWYSSITSPTYGIDYSDTITTPSAVIETELIPTGTTLQKQTYSQIEYKLAAPLAANETVTMSYRQNGTAAFTACGTFIVESTTSLSGYVPVNFEKGQWLQLQITLNPLASSSSSFVRLKQVIIR